MSVEFGASITSVPYNEGAARFFSEQGFEVPAAEAGIPSTQSLKRTRGAAKAPRLAHEEESQCMKRKRGCWATT